MDDLLFCRSLGVLYILRWRAERPPYENKLQKVTMTSLFEVIRVQYATDYGVAAMPDPFAPKPAASDAAASSSFTHAATDPGTSLKNEMLEASKLLIKKTVTLLAPINNDPNDIVKQCLATPACTKDCGSKETRLTILCPALFAQVTKRPQMTPANFFDKPFDPLRVIKTLEGSLGEPLGRTYH